MLHDYFTTYDPPGDMDLESDYYFRVDVVHAGGTETGTIYHFTMTEGPPTTNSRMSGIEYPGGN